MLKIKLLKTNLQAMPRTTKTKTQKVNRFAVPVRFLAGFVALLLGLNIGISLPVEGLNAGLLRGQVMQPDGGVPFSPDLQMPDSDMSTSPSASPARSRDMGADSRANTPKVGRDMGADAVDAQNKPVQITDALRRQVVACALAIKQGKTADTAAECQDDWQPAGGAAASSDSKTELQQLAASLNGLGEKYSACVTAALATKDKKDFDEKSADCSAALAEITKKQNELSAKVQAASAEGQAAFAQSSESTALESTFQEIASLQNQLKVKATSSFSSAAVAVVSPAVARPATGGSVPPPSSPSASPVISSGSSSGGALADAPATQAPNRIQLRVATALVQVEPFLKQKGVVSIQASGGMQSNSLGPRKKEEAPGTTMLTQIPDTILGGVQTASLLMSDARASTTYEVTYASGKHGPATFVIGLQDYSANIEYNVQDIVNSIKGQFK